MRRPSWGAPGNWILAREVFFFPFEMRVAGEREKPGMRGFACTEPPTDPMLGVHAAILTPPSDLVCASVAWPAGESRLGAFARRVAAPGLRFGRACRRRAERRTPISLALTVTHFFVGRPVHYRRVRPLHVTRNRRPPLRSLLLRGPVSLSRARARWNYRYDGHARGRVGLAGAERQRRTRRT